MTDQNQVEDAQKPAEGNFFFLPGYGAGVIHYPHRDDKTQTRLKDEDLQHADGDTVFFYPASYTTFAIPIDPGSYCYLSKIPPKDEFYALFTKGIQTDIDTTTAARKDTEILAGSNIEDISMLWRFLTYFEESYRTDIQAGMTKAYSILASVGFFHEYGAVPKLATMLTSQPRRTLFKRKYDEYDAKLSKKAAEAYAAVKARKVGQGAPLAVLAVNPGGTHLIRQTKPEIQAQALQQEELYFERYFGVIARALEESGLGDECIELNYLEAVLYSMRADRMLSAKGKVIALAEIYGRIANPDLTSEGCMEILREAGVGESGIPKTSDAYRKDAHGLLSAVFDELERVFEAGNGKTSTRQITLANGVSVDLNHTKHLSGVSWRLEDRIAELAL